PVNFVDPTGLDMCSVDPATGLVVCIPDFAVDGGTVYGSTGGAYGGGGGGGGLHPPLLDLPGEIQGGGGSGKTVPDTVAGKVKPSCGVNPVTDKPGINATASGKIGELRPGIGGNGGFNTRGGRHQGIDIRAPVGTPVHANRSGEVVRIIAAPGGGYGNAVVIRH